MSDSVIMLANPYDPSKLRFPVLLSEKMDGVAVDLYRTESGEYRARSRDGKPIYSVDHLLESLKRVARLEPGDHLICELYIPGQPFKVISGSVRRNKPCPDLRAYAYDFYSDDPTEMDWDFQRRSDEAALLAAEAEGFHLPWQRRCESQHELDLAIEAFLATNKKAEGVMVRMLHGPHSIYKFGRSHGMMKLKRQATVDIELIKIERAIAEDGSPKDMAGRLICNFKGREVGIGPGKLTHEERKALWEKPWNYIGKIIEVAYMPDASYDALREGRFHAFRPDKTQPSYI